MHIYGFVSKAFFELFGGDHSCSFQLFVGMIIGKSYQYQYP
jgi:hypothetical protein